MLNLTAGRQDRLTRFKGKYLSLRFLSRASWSILRFVIVFGVAYMIIYPFFIKISMAFMTPTDYLDPTVRYIPRHPTMQNIKDTWTALNVLVSGKNTFILSISTSIMQMISCTLVAYGFGRFKFKGRNLLFALVIFTLLVPPQTIMVSLYMHFRFFDVFGIIKAITGNPGINLIDSFWPFLILSVTGLGLKNGLYIYILRQFFRGMPKELEEAAYVDGSGVFRTFLTIMLPSAGSMMITVFLFSFAWQWTDTFYSGLFLNRLSVLSTAMFNSIRDDRFIDPIIVSTQRNTAVMMVVLPLFLVYVIAQRYFVQSIERSGIVG